MFKYTFVEIMSSKHIFGFTIVIPLLMTLHLNDCIKGALAKCATNYYKDGNVCRECPAGYYGDNCTVVCPPSSYGTLCLHKCDCLPCHHVYGCSSTPLTEETTSNDYETRKKIEDKKQASGNILTTSGRSIIISIGSVLCFMLILVIIRELWLCCQFP
ncbi:uncharacterized protein LOC128158524 [Crassostrea angulata]|uniref:uncharacterized protein LOC128158524 n=1 Tax=Magallana angulata TaxID=2784310 RepID=UPI0022B1E404|nr:uncharacterized protein LOC128158524 [Crassostrea angulata]